jgi:hypothetical protein
VKRAEWMKHLRTAFEDAHAAAEDMLRPPRKRGLGPRQHRKLYRGAAKQIRSLLDHPPDDAPEDDAPAPPDGADPAQVPVPIVPDTSPCMRAPHHPLVRAALDTTYAQRCGLPPLDRARQRVLCFFARTWGAPVRGTVAEEINAIVPDIVAAAVEAVRAELRPAPVEGPAAG